MLAFGSGQAPLRHTRGPAESCFLPDLTRFTGSRCAGPDPQRLVRVVPLRRPEPRAGIQPPLRGFGVQGTTSSPPSTVHPGGYTAPGSIDAPGGVRERPNRHAWKACVGQLTVGSNPTPSASRQRSGSCETAGPKRRHDRIGHRLRRPGRVDDVLRAEVEVGEPPVQSATNGSRSSGQRPSPRSVARAQHVSRSADSTT